VEPCTPGTGKKRARFEASGGVTCPAATMMSRTVSNATSTLPATVVTKRVPSGIVKGSGWLWSNPTRRSTVAGVGGRIS
jgi:hypothetical protein